MLSDLLGGTIKGKGMMEAEISEDLGYEKSAGSECSNARNGYKSKKVRNKYSEIDIDVPQDHESTFQPRVCAQKAERYFSYPRVSSSFALSISCSTSQNISFNAPRTSSDVLKLFSLIHSFICSFDRMPLKHLLSDFYIIILARRCLFYFHKIIYILRKPFLT